MSFTEHLEELRKRAIRVLVILAAGFSICYAIGDKISTVLLLPLWNALGEKGEVVYLGILDKVLAQFQLAFWSAIIFTSPLWFREVWGFIKPGLYAKEIKVIRPFLFVAFFFFCAGIAFGYFIVFPYALPTLLDFGQQGITATISFKDYLILSVKILVFLGVIFQLPNAMLILGFLGLVTKQSLSGMRRYVYVAFVIVSAVLTPPDVITLLFIWVPLISLYEIGVIAVALIVHPYLKRQHLPAEKESGKEDHSGAKESSKDTA
jgi:sec-independent protein translocase protein TatC